MGNSRYLIKNASVVNEGDVFNADVLLEGGIIARICTNGEHIPENGAETIDAKGRYLLPGIIDEHVHFREPGLTWKADIHSESRAAAAGGVTSFMDMPNTSPATVTNSLLEEKFRIASRESLVNYSFYLGATDDNLKEIAAVDKSRVCGIKLFMGSSTGNMLVDKEDILEALFREAPCLIAAHCEDEQTIKAATERCKSLVKDGKMIPDASCHPFIRSSQACYTATARAVELAARTGARLHILHVSTKAELSLFQSDTPLPRKKITAETCPHYLHFDEKDYNCLGFSIKCNPAIKTAEDRLALLDALGSGRIDTIGSDHAPHLPQEKDTADIFTSKSGFPSIQHSFQIMYEAVLDGYLTIQQLVSLMCHNPATLYGIQGRGFIREGYHADVVIADPGSRCLILDSGELTKCGWSPYDGRQVRSRITHTFVNGNLVYENGSLHEDTRGESLVFKRQ